MTAFDELRRIPLFEGLSDGDLEQVARLSSEKFVPAGEVNGREGEPAEYLYVILEGELRITKQVDVVEVTDDGPGIPREDHARIFEPFYTTKDVGEGTGLGLDVSYRIVVRRHGGDIRVVSDPSETRFEVRLPVDGPDDAEAVAGKDLRLEAGA